jgi:hypothetical protein
MKRFKGRNGSWMFYRTTHFFARLGAAYHGLKWNNDFTSINSWALLGFLYTVLFVLLIIGLIVAVNFSYS